MSIFTERDKIRFLNHENPPPVPILLPSGKPQSVCAPITKCPDILLAMVFVGIIYTATSGIIQHTNTKGGSISLGTPGKSQESPNEETNILVNVIR